MPARNVGYKPLKSAGSDKVVFDGFFQFNGTSDPTVYALDNGVTVAHTSGGHTWTITLPEVFVKVSAFAQVQTTSVANKDLTTNIGAVSVTGRTVVVRTMTGATATAPAISATGDGINFVIIARRSQVK